MFKSSTTTSLLLMFLIICSNYNLSDGRTILLPRLRRSGFSDQTRAALETIMALRRQGGQNRNSIITYDPSKRSLENGGQHEDEEFLDWIEGPIRL